MSAQKRPQGDYSQKS